MPVSTSQTAQKKQSPFHTVVPIVDRFPLPITILGSLLLLVNVFGFVTMLFNISMLAPGLPTGSALQGLAYMMAGRQLGVTIVFALGLFGKNVRLNQLGWGLAFLRELSDMVGPLLSGQIGSAQPAGLVLFIVLMLLELACFVYLGMIASGRVPKYVHSAKARH